jgi:excisionase family DNA binding protein
MPNTNPAMTVEDVAARLAVSYDTVRAWILSGELRAMNVARKLGQKPRWRVTLADMELFEAMRYNKPPSPSAARRPRKSKAAFEWF